MHGDQLKSMHVQHACLYRAQEKENDNEAKPVDLALAHADCAALLRAVATDAAVQLAVLKAEAEAAAAAERSAEEAQAAIARCGQVVLNRPC